MSDKFQMSEKSKIFSFFLLFLIIFSQDLFTQDQAKIDSLENLLVPATGRERFELLVNLSGEIVRTDNSRSLELADEAISIAENLSDIQLEISGYINKGYLYEAVMQDNEALKMFEKALEVSERENIDKGRTEALYRIGRSYSFQGDLARSDEYLARALNIARDMKDMKMQGEIQYEQAENLRRSGNIQESLVNYKNTLEISQKAEDLNTMASIYSSIGGIYSAQGNFNEAIKNYEESRQLRIQQGNNLKAAQMNNNIANAYYNLAKYDMAIEYYQKALPVYEQYKYNSGIASVYNGMAVIYFQQGFFDKALENHLKKLDINRDRKSVV